jgi:hypothetical protein
VLLKFFLYCLSGVLVVFTLAVEGEAYTVKAVAQDKPQGTSAIAGQVTSEGGPSTGTQVEALQAVLTRGSISLETRCSAKTDDRGDYTCLGLPAGTYYLVARDSEASSDTPAKHPLHMRGFTYYYLTTDLASAETVTLAEGAGKVVDLRLVRSAKYSILGRISSRPDSVTLTLFSRKSDSQEIYTGLTARYVTSNGSFIFEAVPPGHYAIHVLWHDAEAAHSLESMVSVSDQDVTGIDIATDGAHLELTVISCPNGDRWSGGLELVRADGKPINGSGTLPGKATGTEGNRFVFPALLAGGYFVHPIGKAGTFVDSTTLSDGGQGNLIYLSDGNRTTAGSVQLSCQASVLQGDVQENEGRSTTVVAINVATGERFLRISNDKGEFAIQNLAPGAYHVYALSDQADPFGFDPASTSGSSTDVAPGETARVTIRAPGNP